MPCYYPLAGHDRNGLPTPIPCGQCIGCRLEYSRQWAVRAYHESTLHEESCFLRLSYRNEDLPTVTSISTGRQIGTLSKRDFQLFMKRLRRKIEPKEVRFFACGEYGDRFSRPHYHALLFGHNFDDKEIYRVGFKNRNRKSNRRTNEADLFKSQELEDIWGKGYCTIGEVTLESAAYVARYTMKKIKGKESDAYYDGRLPEFALMSRRPGLGNEWFNKYMTDLYPKDFFTINGKKMKPVAYYDYLYKKVYPERFEEIKAKRIKKVGLLNPKIKRQTPKERWLKSKYRKEITKNLNRRFENEGTYSL